MTPTRRMFRVVIVTAVLWAVASTHTGTMGPVTTYREAISLACAGEFSEALRTFWIAAGMFSCFNDLLTTVGLFSVVVHCVSVFILVWRAFLSKS
jgi:hypothetical protein